MLVFVLSFSYLRKENKFITHMSDEKPKKQKERSAAQGAEQDEGYDDLDPTKDCPCFDAAHEYADMQPR